MSEIISVYNVNGHWAIDVVFPKSWQARVFHWVLNKSHSHLGSRAFHGESEEK